MKKYLLILILTFLIGSLASCNNLENPAGQTKPDERLEQELDDIVISEDDFLPKIGTLPYRGAVLFIDYQGEANLSGYEIFVDIFFDGKLKQERMPVEEVDGDFVATIIDLMYLPGDELDFVITIEDDNEEVLKYSYSEALKRYPWKDWIFDIDEPISVKVPGTKYNFKYNWPGIVTGLGAHSSWDFMTRSSDGVKVYSGTEGIVLSVSEYRGEYNVYLYNPYVGAIIQNGHLAGGIDLINGQFIFPGDFLGKIAFSSTPHNHYSVIRPFDYTRNIEQSAAKYTHRISTDLYGYYWPIWSGKDGSIFDAKYYKDPYYFHEPTTLGYWYEETLPEGLKEEMIRIFKRDNPDIILPATKPLD